MTRSQTFHAITLFCAAALLSACGGGGGGGDATDVNPPPVFTQPSDYVQKFNPYLPLTNGSAFTYEEASIGFEIPETTQISFERSEGDLDIYTLTFPLGTNSITLHISSTPEQILLYQIDGPIDVDSYSVESIKLKNPIQFYPPTSAVTNATATVSGISANVSVNYTSSNANLVFDENYGMLPTLEIELVTTVSATFPPVSETFTTTLELAQGIGIVRNQGSYGATSIAYNLKGVTNLPATIWFDNNAGVPILASSTDQFTINGVTLKPSLYDLLNEAEINDLEWITVRADTASDSFIVTMHADNDLPDTLTSVEVVFERKSDALRMSGNVTLHAEGVTQNNPNWNAATSYSF
ncbi:hypothetical protein FT643_16100 [Ketobacter sp. MCCC 1A13808]|uniref:hypothetical protein n=1 Tax=Ketobacter sp. MCCC 1A13808 TaxID=2602738 RepID=UPI0012EB76C1|nr:hypothetical protein [Ketobacter sp. MCCC 1A13808]MVF13666.1 hypothetical protein [Ketobacter sp. MCCC 1A13808]